tara:strand:+ start:58815 stop:60245 length:1431 start_codon:yes stop_codon:yes gene_type:complete
MNINALCASLIITCIYAHGYTQTHGDIPDDRLSATNWQDFRWDDSGDWKIIDVSKNGIMPNTKEDIAPNVMKIISEGSGKRILQFPEGTYQIASRLDIEKGDIQIVGKGNTTKFMLAGGEKPANITIRGKRVGHYGLASDVKRGDSKLILNSTEGLEVNDFIVIKQKGAITRPSPGVSGDETQIVKIISKIGNTLTIDMNFGIPFLKAHASIAKMDMIKNLRFHNFYIEMTSKPLKGKSHNISASEIQNVEFSNIVSNKALHSHIELSWSRDVILSNNYVHGNFGHDKEGWYQYGIKLSQSTQCYVINNRASDLRHHYATQMGTNHCVIAYNRAEPPYNHYGDFGQHNSKGCHNNLWEGNYGSEIYDDDNPKKSWGTRYTTWFRNHAISKVGSESPYVEHMTIIGNELEGGIDAIKSGPATKNNFSGANLINVGKKESASTLKWGDMQLGDSIPASLFLIKKPDYLNKWPLFGPSN